MNTSIVSRKIDLTDAMRDHIQNAIGQFEKYNLDIIAVKSIVSESKKNKKPGFEVEFTIQLAKRDTIVIKQVDQDFYAATDMAVERVKKVLRRYHEKMTDKIHSHDNEKSADVPHIYSDVEEDEIVPAAADVDKPMEPAEAMQMLKDTNMMFLVFNDKDGKMRVMYRRKDGKFGLY